MSFYPHLSQAEALDMFPPLVRMRGTAIADLFKEMSEDGKLNNANFRLMAHMLHMIIVKLKISGNSESNISWYNNEFGHSTYDYRITPKCGLCFPGDINVERYLEYAMVFLMDLKTTHEEEDLSHYDLWTVFGYANEHTTYSPQVERWLIESALMGGHDEQVAAALRTFIQQPRCSIPASDCDLDIEYVRCEESVDHSASDATLDNIGLVQLSGELRKFEQSRSQLTKNEIRLVLEELIRVGNDTVEALLAFDRIKAMTTPDPAARKIDVDEFGLICGNSNILHFDLRISDPDSPLPIEVRRILAKHFAPHFFAAQVLRSGLFPYSNFIQHGIDGTANFLAYRTIVRAFIRPEVDPNGTFSETVDELFDPVWKLEDPASFPKGFKPSFCGIDMDWVEGIFGESNAGRHVRGTAGRPNLYEEEDMTVSDEESEEPFEYEPAAPLHEEYEAVGPEILPGTVGTPVSYALIPPSDAMCVICQEDFSPSSAQVYFMLTSCTHVVHQSCLHPWLNVVSMEPIRCPLCRAELCNPRPLQPRPD